AIESLKKVVESMPDNKDAYIMLGRSYLELKEYDLAIEIYKKVLDFRSLLELAYIHTSLMPYGFFYLYIEEISAHTVHNYFLSYFPLTLLYLQLHHIHYLLIPQPKYLYFLV
ncbi:MAG: hypothetical protein DRZ76_02455, partial [Candidatus Nealsonbacteria bacterium]